MKKLLGRLYRKFFLKKHQLPVGVLIHRRKNTVIFEIEFNWYDEDFQPVSLIREVKSGKIFSIRHAEMYEFKEYAGSDPNAGSTL
jgi:light-regulated signal transduction histidine kinase (bacteriophytochrome)